MKMKPQGQGFTLIEALVAITIMSFAIVATFTSAQSGLASAIESRDEVVGYFLAQEAVEFIRNKRDTNSLEGVNWLAGIAEDGDDPCYPGKACTVDAVTNALDACPTGQGSCAGLRQDQTQSSNTYGMFGMNSGWASTAFTRELEIEVIDATREIVLTVTITRVKGMSTREFTIKESIFNWQI